MKNLIYVVIVILMLTFAPVIPYENDSGNGIVRMENKTVVSYLYERYQMVQASKEAQP